MNNQPSNFVLGMLDRPDVLCALVAYELTSTGQIEANKRVYETLRAELESEWPPSRIKNYIIERKRLLYKRSALLIQKTELANKDARAKGESYNDRQRFTRKIKAGYGYVRKLKQEAATAKATTYSVQSMVKPTDVSFIQRMGFEEFLNIFY